VRQVTPRQTSPTLLALHAHPDDEAIYTGGLLASATKQGWLCTVVVATSGEQGLRPFTIPESNPQHIASHRISETAHAASLLGVDRLEFLGYHDSGMAGTTPPPNSLAAADSDQRDAKVQALVDQIQPDVIISYDPIGIYGHPDHIAIHQIGRNLKTTAALYEATISRADLLIIRAAWIHRGMPEYIWPASLAEEIGTDHHKMVAFPVGDFLALKQAAVAAHSSQIVTASSFMGLPPGVFHSLLETEWYIPVRPSSGPLPQALSPLGSDHRHQTSDGSPALQGRKECRQDALASVRNTIPLGRSR